MPLPAINATIDDAELGIVNAFVDHWDKCTPIRFENKEFPEDDKKDTGWIAWFLNYTAGLSGQRYIGDEMRTVFTRQGIIQVQCFVPKGSGEQRMAELIEKALKYFEAVPPTPGWVEFINQGPAPGDPNDGDWYNRRVTTQFVYDVLREREA